MYVHPTREQYQNAFGAVPGGKQMNNEWLFSILNDEQISNKVGV